eukprot:2767731-Pyramimonas_sp.AAC.1
MPCCLQPLSRRRCWSRAESAVASRVHQPQTLSCSGSSLWAVDCCAVPMRKLAACPRDKDGVAC